MNPPPCVGLFDMDGIAFPRGVSTCPNKSEVQPGLVILLINRLTVFISQVFSAVPASKET